MKGTFECSHGFTARGLVRVVLVLLRCSGLLFFLRVGALLGTARSAFGVTTFLERFWVNLFPLFLAGGWYWACCALLCGFTVFFSGLQFGTGVHAVLTLVASK